MTGHRRVFSFLNPTRDLVVGAVGRQLQAALTPSAPSIAELAGHPFDATPTTLIYKPGLDVSVSGYFSIVIVHVRFCTPDGY